jgi:hypothetical protein
MSMPTYGVFVSTIRKSMILHVFNICQSWAPALLREAKKSAGVRRKKREKSERAERERKSANSRFFVFGGRRLYVCMYICMYALLYVCMYVFKDVGMWGCKYVGMYV